MPPSLLPQKLKNCQRPFEMPQTVKHSSENINMVISFQSSSQSSTEAQLKHYQRWSQWLVENKISDERVVVDGVFKLAD
jgi:hypothetical protein